MTPPPTLNFMVLGERHWLSALAAGGLVVAGLTLGPLVLPRPQVPSVTHTALPAVATPATATQATEPPSYATTASIAPLTSGRVNLNTATLEQLESLPKVGAALAGRIVAGRPYRSLADLDRVKGVGPATLNLLSPLVTF